MQTHYAQAYQQLYEQHWWWRARERFVLSALQRHRVLPGGRILDVGCGNGLFFGQLAHYGAVEGIESDASLISDAQRSDGTIHVGRFDANFQPGYTYQLILMLDVLEHLQDPLGALRHALQLLESNGTLLITVPAYPLLWTQHDVLNRHYTRFRRRPFRQLAQQAEMRLDECRYFYHWLFPTKLTVRLAERLRRGQPQPPRLPARPINQLCYAISRCEQQLCRRLPLPFGSSLLAVGGHAQGTDRSTGTPFGCGPAARRR